MARKRGATGPAGATIGEEVTGLSSGYGVIDLVSGVPGVLFPSATIIELYGKKSASKTTLVLEVIAYNQTINPDFRVYYADFEKMLRKQTSYLGILGVDITDKDKFKVGAFDTMEEGCAEILDVIRNDSYDLVVVDTVAAMRPAVEVEKGFAGNKQIGLKAKLMSEFLRNIMADMPADGPAVVFINQVYRDVSVTFAPVYTTPSSDALGFYAGMRIEVVEKSKVKAKRVNPYTLEEEDVPVYSIIEIKTTKNKVGLPFIPSKYAITFGKGIDISLSIITAAQRAGIIKNKGASKSSFLYPGADGTEKAANGMNQLTSKIQGNLDDLIYIGSQINDLWARDMKYLKPRLERRAKVMNLMEAYEFPDDEEEESVGGEALSLEDEATPEGVEGEATTLDLNSMAQTAAPTLKMKPAATPTSASTGSTPPGGKIVFGKK